jgi:hypothetical protein
LSWVVTPSTATKAFCTCVCVCVCAVSWVRMGTRRCLRSVAATRWWCDNGYRGSGLGLRGAPGGAPQPCVPARAFAAGPSEEQESGASNGGRGSSCSSETRNPVAHRPSGPPVTSGSRSLNIKETLKRYGIAATILHSTVYVTTLSAVFATLQFSPDLVVTATDWVSTNTGDCPVINPLLGALLFTTIAHLHASGCPRGPCERTPLCKAKSSATSASRACVA